MLLVSCFAASTMPAPGCKSWFRNHSPSNFAGLGLAKAVRLGDGLERTEAAEAREAGGEARDAGGEVDRGVPSRGVAGVPLSHFFKSPACHFKSSACQVVWRKLGY